MAAEWTLEELVGRAGQALTDARLRAPNGRVTALPDARIIRWYATTGLVDRPSAMRGRTALYGLRHLLQLIAIKRRQAQGRTLAEIQAELAGATNAMLRQVADIDLRPDAEWLAPVRRLIPPASAETTVSPGTTVSPETTASPETTESPETTTAQQETSATQGTSDTTEPLRSDVGRASFWTRLPASPTTTSPVRPFIPVSPSAWTDSTSSPATSAVPVTPASPVSPGSPGTPTVVPDGGAGAWPHAGGDSDGLGGEASGGEILGAVDDDSVELLYGIRLGPAAVLLVARPPAPADLIAIRAAARPLLDLLVARQAAVNPVQEQK